MSQLPRQSLIVAVLLLTACSGDRSQELRDVLVPGYETPSSVLYSFPGHQDCDAVTDRLNEVVALQESKQSFRDGFEFVDKSDLERSYRAFFKPTWIEAVPYEGAIIFCQPGVTPIGIGCSVIGLSPKGCFMTAYGGYRLSEIDRLLGVIRQSFPAWASAGGT